MKVRGKILFYSKRTLALLKIYSADYDDDTNKVMKWKDSGETDSPKGAIELKPFSDKLQKLGNKPLLKYLKKSLIMNG